MLGIKDESGYFNNSEIERASKLSSILRNDSHVQINRGLSESVSKSRINFITEHVHKNLILNPASPRTGSIFRDKIKNQNMKTPTIMLLNKVKNAMGGSHR